MKRAVLFTICGFFCVLPAGCGTEPVQSSQPICVSNTDVHAVMDSAQAVLGRMNFTIEKADLGDGYVRTHPLAGGQFFEFWRDDNIGRFSTSEANIQTIRRTVEMNIDGGSGRVCVDCVVTAERMSMPQQDAPGASGVAGLFTRSGWSLQRLELNPAQRQDVSWVGLGRDGGLEAEILKRLRAKL